MIMSIRMELDLLEQWLPKPTGRKPADWRKRLNGVIYDLPTRCQCSKRPTEFGDDSIVHRWFSRW